MCFFQTNAFSCVCIWRRNSIIINIKSVIPIILQCILYTRNISSDIINATLLNQLYRLWLNLYTDFHTSVVLSYIIFYGVSGVILSSCIPNAIISSNLLNEEILILAIVLDRYWICVFYYGIITWWFHIGLVIGPRSAALAWYLY